VLTVGVGERPEVPEQEERPTNGRGNGNRNETTRGKRGRPRRTVASLGTEEGEIAPRPTRRRSSGNGGGNGGDGGNGERRDAQVRRLLAGLRALEAGDFAVRLDASDDRLMDEVADIFNSVATKQQRLAEELDRVALSVGREGKMRDRATIGPASGLWAGSVDAL
jgi:hypothetical protein